MTTNRITPTNPTDLTVDDGIASKSTVSATPAHGRGGRRRLRRLAMLPAIAMVMLGATAAAGGNAHAEPAPPASAVIEGSKIKGDLLTQNVRITLTSVTLGGDTFENVGLPWNRFPTDSTYHYSYASPLFKSDANVKFTYRIEGSPYEVVGEMNSHYWDYKIEAHFQDASTHKLVSDPAYRVTAQVVGTDENPSFDIGIYHSW